MANMCGTDIVFVAKESSYEPCMNALRQFHQKLLNLFMTEGKFPHLTAIAREWGIPYGDEYGYEHVNGELYFVEDISDNPSMPQFYISQEDKWLPNCKIWIDIISSYYSENGEPLIEVYYKAEEPGCDVFLTNDPESLYVPDTDTINFYMDIYTPLTEYDNSLKFIEKRPNNPFLRIDQEILSEGDIGLNKRYSDDGKLSFYIHEYDTCNFTDTNQIIDYLNDYVFSMPITSLEETANMENISIIAEPYSFREITDL